MDIAVVRVISYAKNQEMPVSQDRFVCVCVFETRALFCHYVRQREVCKICEDESSTFKFLPNINSTGQKNTQLWTKATVNARVQHVEVGRRKQDTGSRARFGPLPSPNPNNCIARPHVGSRYHQRTGETQKFAEARRGLNKTLPYLPSEKRVS